MKNRKVVAFILTLSLVFSPFSVSFAATESTAASTNPVTFSDVTEHWGAAAISKWSGYGIINGYEGLFRPDDPITRGEMAVILDNMMDYQEVASNTFTDLQAGQFYTDAVLKANAAGIVRGDGVTVRPTDKITKEEAAIMMSRAFAVSESNSTKAFLDASAVSEWAKGAVFGMEAKGYVSGFGGYFNPKANITRAEALTMINNIVKAYYTAAGTYTDNVRGTAVIKVADVILKGVTISENLIIAEGVAQGDATLDSVTVKGETVIRGGGENSVHITGNSVITKVTIEKVGDKLRVVIDDGITVTNVEVAAGEEIIITGSVGTVELNAPGAVVYANAAEINSATITGDNSTIVVGAQSTLNNVTVSSTADNTSIRTETGAVVGAITASSEVEVSGTGTVTKVTLQAGADGSSVTTPNTATTVPTGVTGVTGGGGTSIPAGSTGTNSSTGTTATVATNTTPTGGGGGGGSSTIAVTGVTVTSTAVTIATDNGTLQMSAVIAPANASNQNVTWSVTNGTGYATINSSGLLTAVSDGTVTVSAVSVSNGTVSGSLGITLSNQVLDAITTAGATRTSPAVGEPGANATISTSANYTHTSTVWSGKAGANYAVGETPAAIITLEAKTGYDFTGLAAGSITVAGGTVTYGGGQGVVSSGAFVIFTVTYPQLTATIPSATATCTSPAIGEAGASAAVSGSANYTLASTTWTGRSGGTFVAGETPAAIVTLTAKAGYGFTGLLASNITVAGGTVSYGAGQGVTAGGLSVVFTVTYSQLVGTLSAATVTVTAPALGVSPPNAAAVEAATSNANYTVSSVTWNGTLTSTGKFKADTAYSATIVLTSKNFYKFQAGAFTPTVASALSVGTTTTVGTAIGNTASFTASFTSTGALTVSSINVTTQPTQLSYFDGTTLSLNGLVIMETNNDSSTAAALFPSGVNANYSASPANGTTLTTAYNGTPVAITHNSTGKIATTTALAVASTVSALSGADVSLTAGSIVFDYDFTGTSGAISYAQGQLAPYYLNPVASTVTLTNGISSTSAVSLSTLGISDDGVVSYAAITSIGAVFTGLDFIPSQVVINLVGATSVNGGANQWTYNIGINLDLDEIGLLTPDPITAVTVSVTAPAIGVALEDAAVAPGSNCIHTLTAWTGKAGATYGAGETPAAIVSLSADTDYTFTGLTAGNITVAGGTVSFEAGQGVTAGGMAVTFTVSYTQLIASITTAGAVCASPTIGGVVASSPNATVDGSAGYTHSTTVWSGAAGANWAAGETPVATITLASKTGYTFTGLSYSSITVAGGTVSYEAGQGVQGGGAAVVFTVAYPLLVAASTPSSIVLAAGSTNGALAITNVAIPASGATDSTGAFDWASGTNDKIKFTVTDDTGTSTITIDGAAYTSGQDYTVTSSGLMTIIVTTTEAGKADCVRTFAITASPADFATTPAAFTLASGGTNPATIGAIISTIPAPSATNSEGSVIDWITGTNDRITFTVTASGSETSTIKINGGAYTSGTDYTVTTVGALTIVVTTTETDKVTAIRTFTVSVTAAPYATAPSNIVLAAGDSNSATINTHISAIPDPGGTNTQGVLTGWNAGTADKIKFNVTDAGGSSTITINGSSYTSGNDYTITQAGILTIIVTTTETGKTPAVRTFSVQVTDSVNPIVTAITLYDFGSMGSFGEDVNDEITLTFSESMDITSVPNVADLENLLTFGSGIIDNSNLDVVTLWIRYTDSTTLVITVMNLNGSMTTNVVTAGSGENVCVNPGPTSLQDPSGNPVNGPTAGSELTITITP